MTLAREAPLALDVALQIHGARADVLHTEEALGLDAASAQVPAAGPADLPGCRAPCTHRYRYEVERAAERSQDAYDVAIRGGRGVVAPLSSLLVYPVGLAPEALVELRFELPAGVRLISSLPGVVGGARRVLAKELPYLGYVSIGRFESLTFERAGAVVEVALAGDVPADLGPFSTLVRGRLAMLERLYGKLPAPRTSVFAVWSAGDEPITFGRTMGTGGATVLLALGRDAKELDGDWVLLHELIHVGIPTLGADGRFFDEGLATYLEPLLRVGFGGLGEDRAFGELARGLPFGARQSEDDDIGGGAWGRTYWGGAHFALRLDLAVRERSSGALGLADLLRATSEAGLDARRWMALDAFLAELDRAAGAPVATQLYRSFRARCSPLLAPGCPDDGAAIERSLAALGVRPDGRLLPGPREASARRALALGPRTGAAPLAGPGR